MRALALLVLVTLALAALPAPSTAQSGSDLDVRVIHDLHEDGYAVVGNLAHFGFLVLDADGLPDRHHDVALTLDQNGERLFASDALHDYDGVGGFDWTFTHAGPFVLNVTVDGERTASFNGTAVVPEDVVDARLSIQAPASVTAGAPADFRFMLVDARSGELLAHKDALVEITRASDGERVFRTHTHTHEEEQAFTFAFPEAGDFDVTLTAFDAFPRPGRPALETLTSTHRVSVQPGAAVPDALAAPAPDAAPVTPRASDGAPRLVVTHDPGSVVGPFTFTRANALVLANGTTLQHVDFTARLVDPLGRTLFESATLHEYDGVLEVAGTWRTTGTYALHVTASYREWSASDVVTWTVVPPATPTDPGVFRPAVTEGAAVDFAGEPWNLTLTARDDAGRPLPHAELDVTVTRAGEGAPLFTAKLHTHASGDYPFAFAFPDAGSFDVHVTGTTTTASASIIRSDVLTVTAGAPRLVADDAQDAAVAGAGPSTDVPPFPGILAVGALVLAFLAVAILGKR